MRLFTSMWQGKFLSPVWVLLCVFKSEVVAKALHKFHKKCPLFCMDSSNVVCQGGILCEEFSTVDTSKPSAPHHICKGFHTTAKNPVDIKLCLLYNTESIHEYCPSTSSRITTSSSSDSAWKNDNQLMKLKSSLASCLHIILNQGKCEGPWGRSPLDKGSHPEPIVQFF